MMMQITDAPCAWLTTVRPDGSPHTTPVWFVLRDDTFFIASAATNVKVRNIVADDRVSIAIDGSATDPHVAQGRARIRREIGELPDVVSLFAQKYNDWNVLDEAADGPRVMIETPVDRWLLGGS